MSKRPSFLNMVANIGASTVVSAARKTLSRLGSVGSAISRAVGLSSRSTRSRLKVDISNAILDAMDKGGYSPPARYPPARTVDTRQADQVKGFEPPGGGVYVGDEFDEVEQLPRAEYPRLPADEVFTGENWIHTYGSSNVYAIAYQQTERRNGILYVRFLNWAPGMSQYERGGPGPVYAYYDVTPAKWQQFKFASKGSAGGAVWDYLRIRGSEHGHQHQYTLQEGGTMLNGGTYVPRKQGARGLRQRTLADPGTGRRGATISQLTLRPGDSDRIEPNRGRPNRGRPDRGRPDRG